MSKIGKPNFIKYLLEAGASESTMTPDRIKLIRDHFSLTQVKMVNYETYRSWEEGCCITSSLGYAVLVTAEKYPEIFIKNRKDIFKEFKQLYCRNNT